MKYFLVFALVICGSLSQASGHGRMMEPVARSSAWRLGWGTPPNYDDMALRCGGLARQERNGGKCGICGDPWDAPVHENEAGGKYAKGKIVRTYKMGQVIQTRAELTANHFGYMEYRICPNNNFNKEATQECLDQHVLERADGKGTKVIIDTRRTGDWIMNYTLPAGMTCSQCVVQWKYHAGNNDGVDPLTGQRCLGCGPQEEFYGCADVAIEGDGPVVPPQLIPDVTVSTRAPPPVTQRTPAQTQAQRVPSTTPPEFIGVKTLCKGINNWAGDPHMDQWCTDSCSRGNCPAYGCDCTGANQVIHQAETTTTTTTTTPSTTTTTPTTTTTTPTTTTPRPTTTTTPRPTTTFPTTRAITPMQHQEVTTKLVSRTECKAINLWEGNEYLDRWCADACAHGNCPPDSCQCTVIQHVVTEPTTTLLYPETGTPQQPPASTEKVCKAVALWKGIDVFDRWCTDECNNRDNCPPETCECTGGSLQTQSTTTTTTTDTTTTTSVMSTAARSGMTCTSNGIVGGDYWNGWCQRSCDRGTCPLDYCLCM